MNLETEGKISQAVPNFCRHYYFRSSHVRCSVKKVLLEISQNSQENTCARDSFWIKLQARPATLSKNNLWYRCFLWILWNFPRMPFLQNISGRLLLLFPHKTAYSSNNPHNAFCRWQLKVYISTKTKILKIDIFKTTGIAKNDVKLSVILVNKYEVKANNFIIPISVYGN